jgi:prevent-host-death family protein
MDQRVSMREIKQRLARYVRAAEDGERIVITRRGEPVALLLPLPWQEKPLDAAQEAALRRLLSQRYHLGGRAASRVELHER